MIDPFHEREYVPVRAVLKYQPDVIRAIDCFSDFDDARMAEFAEHYRLNYSFVDFALFD